MEIGCKFPTRVQGHEIDGRERRREIEDVETQRTEKGGGSGDGREEAGRFEGRARRRREQEGRIDEREGERLKRGGGGKARPGVKRTRRNARQSLIPKNSHRCGVPAKTPSSKGLLVGWAKLGVLSSATNGNDSILAGVLSEQANPEIIIKNI